MTENKDNKSSKGQWHGGKGSIQKPSDQDKYSENYDKIFGKKKKNKRTDSNSTPQYEGPWGKDLGLT